MNPKDKWNAKYRERTESPTEPEPNRHLQRLTHNLPGGTALELACGLGGNSLYLARTGYDVQALDISEVAISFLKEKAAMENLRIATGVFDLTNPLHFDKLHGPFDLVVVTNYLNRKLFPMIKEIIRQDGYFFMETYYQSPLTETQRVSDRFKLEPKELLSEFGEWHVLAFEEDEETGKQMIFCQKK